MLNELKNGLRHRAKASLVDLVHRRWSTLVIGKRFPGITIVTRRQDAIEIFERAEDFSVAIQGIRMRSCIGDQVLGMADGPAYQRDIGIMRSVAGHSTVADLPRFLFDTSQELIEHATRYKATVDIVSELVDPLALRYIESYFGVADPGAGALLRWFRMTSWYFFYPYLFNSPAIEVPSVRAGQKIIAHLRSQVALRRRQPGDARDDVLGRLLRLRDGGEHDIDDGDVARLLAGMISGSVGAPFAQAINAIDQILDLPEHELEGAREAARRTNGDVVLDYMREGARFAPVLPIITRYCERGAVIARGTDRETVVPPHSLVLLFVPMANLDASAIADPFEFRPGRPAGEQLVYGHALHYCVGAHIADLLMREIGRAILSQAVLQRAPGPAGRKQHGPRGSFPDGMYARSLIVQMREGG